ncbi:replication factor A protein 1-like isoform X2 [Tripterygium wilfordii]|uniref:Replication factor A protein 1-like isoform X2 n=1 Tax=Tripterygium wilfordii TaxID=458696 RepID=A0A7J7C9F5_TRIWF|nr:replication factor A protein 1-like isoform X2 [Tripterygium wilfordii]
MECTQERDIRNKKINIALWGGKMTDFQGQYAEKKISTSIVIVSSTTVKTYMGEYSLSTTSSTKIYINLDIAETEQLISRDEQQEVHTIENQRPPQLPLAEQMSLNRKTLKELTTISMADVQNSPLIVTTFATIQTIYNKYGWYYLSCEN